MHFIWFSEQTSLYSYAPLTCRILHTRRRVLTAYYELNLKCNSGCESFGFRSGVIEVCIRVGYDAALLYNLFATF